MQKAIDEGKIADFGSDEDKERVIRQLDALVANIGNLPKCEIAFPGNAYNLVEAWADYNANTDINVFWGSLTNPNLEGHLALLICFLAKGHTPLVDVIGDYLNHLASAAPPATVTNLVNLTTIEWVRFFFPCIPNLYCGESIEKGINNFLQQAAKIKVRLDFDLSTATLNDVLKALTELDPIAPGNNVYFNGGLTNAPLNVGLISKIETYLGIGAGSLAVNNLRGLSSSDWETIIAGGHSATIPPTLNANLVEEVEKLLKEVGRCWEIPCTALPTPNPVIPTPASFDCLIDTCLSDAVNAGSLTFGSITDTQLNAITDECCRAAVQTIDELHRATAFETDIALQFSLMEALYAKGFTSRTTITDIPSYDFKKALIGTVAYDQADAIYVAAGGTVTTPTASPASSFIPVNPDGGLRNCLPPKHLSQISPVSYLIDLLKLKEDSNCSTWEGNTGTAIKTLVEARRGDLIDFDVSENNLCVPIPMVDIVNESLEHLVANGGTQGVVKNTANDQLKDILLTEENREQLFCAIPEHAAPSSIGSVAYDSLKTAFAVPSLPYHLEQDFSNVYLGELGISLFDIKRRFSKNITEFALAPAHSSSPPPNEPDDFKAYLWRYPVRFEIALEYLGITAEEYAELYETNITGVHTYYNFASATGWRAAVSRLDEFLSRTGLCYSDFLNLSKSGFVTLPNSGGAFPEKEPHNLSSITISGFGGNNVVLRKLKIFISLWQKLQKVNNAQYSFEELRDIAEVLQLYNGNTINPDFIRQLAAFQMMRDDFDLDLLAAEENPTSSLIGADRLQLLALWAGNTHANHKKAIDYLLAQIKVYGEEKLGCPDKPDVIKVLSKNLDALSELANFIPDNPDYTWHRKPSHTIRFVEVLCKIYASNWDVEEILFLFHASPNGNLGGEDPFLMQSKNEAHKCPFDLPECSDFSLEELRQKLLDVKFEDMEDVAWDECLWKDIKKILKEEFCFTAADDFLNTFCEHFFPSGSKGDGCEDTINTQKWYCTQLQESNASQWEAPIGSPFFYDDKDVGNKQLCFILPLSNEEVVKRIYSEKLKPLEREAVRELYFQPRNELARLGFLFPNLLETAEQLIQEPDAHKRWNYFQKSFALFYRRCEIVAAYLADHVASVDVEGTFEKGKAAMWEILKNLYADENRSVDNTHEWENNDGTVPNVLWGALPHGGAFAAINGLVGTGLLGEYYELNDGGLEEDDEGNITNEILWREVRGPINAFGTVQNVTNSPVPTVIPALGLSQSLPLVEVYNGYAIENQSGNFLGGAMSYGVRWTGMLLIEQRGKYSFYAGTPNMEGVPTYDANSPQRWRVTLQRADGQKKIDILSKGFGEDYVPCDCSIGVDLLPCAYEITIDYINPAPSFEREEDICPLYAGFQLKYKGTDTEGKIKELPFEKLFRDSKDGLMFEPSPGAASRAVPTGGAAEDYLKNYYTSTIRDIRRTYQRAFKAGLFVRRFALSPVKTTKNQSELSYLLDNGEDFAGTSYYLDTTSGDFVSHKAYFDFNLLPINDIYQLSSPYFDDRYAPSQQRQQALFDWWERIFDHKQLEQAVSGKVNRPLWELYLFEKNEELPTGSPQPKPNEVRKYLGTNQQYVSSMAVLKYFDTPNFILTHPDLDAEEWAVRIYEATKALDEMADNIGLEKGLGDLCPADWVDGAGLSDLAAYVCKSLIDDCEPPRYKALETINNQLRLNARDALIAYLTSSATTLTLPDGTAVTEAKHLSELLLLDAEAGICQKASRVEELITAIQHFVRRYRLGLEVATTSISQQLQFAQLWDKRFATYQIWKKCKMRAIYGENWIEYDKLEAARQTEAFRFLEDKLREQTLSVPLVPEIPNPIPANNVGGLLLQSAEPAITQALPISRQGFDQLATPEIHGRPSWLTAILPNETPRKIPYWIKTAIRLGKKFVRVAAAGQPLNRIYCSPVDGDCCPTCIPPHVPLVHVPLVDEYYFWLIDSEFYEAIAQDANWNWHSDAALPELLQWQAEKKVLLAWTKIHNGEFQQLRFSDEGVHVVEGEAADIQFMGRTADTLRFEITGGITPVGYPNTPLPGFRYDMVTDSAVVLPQLTNPLLGFTDIGDLSAFPSFVYFAPGSTVMPPSRFSAAVTVAANLRAHCRFEAALKVYEQVYHPLQNDNSWDTLSEDNKSILLHYLDTLLQWGDALMKKHAPESFQQARLVFDTVGKILGYCPATILEESDTTIPKLISFNPTQKGINPRLMNLYEVGHDRLELIRNCLNASRHRNGKPNKDMPYFGDSIFKNGWQTTFDVCVAELESCLPHSPYRFQFLLQKAQEFAGEVTSLGAALLSAYEKGDGEYLASLRAYHEKQLLELALEIRKDQWRAADWDVQALYKTQEMAQIRLAYNQELYGGGLNAGESDYVSYTNLSLTELIISKTIEIGAQILRGIPDVLAGFPQMHLPLGSKLAGFVSTISQVFSTMSQYHGTYAGLRNTEGGWDRREREWLHQIELITVEIQQIERQILASERRRDVARRELNNQVQQIENSREVFDFMRDKFSNHELYLWMQKETAALHHQMYELALLIARQAERAYNYERGFTCKKFIDGNMIWDNLHEGLLAGERLQHALRRMEQTYYNENSREYELTKHISLRQHFPLEFLLLKETGCCTIELPEWLFDMDYPGHYMRRIKNVTLSIPSIVGPYTGVHCRLTLLSSRTRIRPHLSKNTDASCLAEGAINNGYPALPDDPRWVHQFIASQAIATSSGQQDSGMFELNFNDDRYLPFEYAGAISCWRIELPRENNYFDMDSLGDVIMHVNYTAREGGELLRTAAREITQNYLPGNGKRLIDVKHDLSQAWHQMMNCDSSDTTRRLKLALSQQMFPYLPCHQAIHIQAIEVVMEISDDFQREQFELTFVPNEKVCHVVMDKGKSPDFSINCVAATDWKTDCNTTTIYQGTIDIQKAGVLLNSKKQHIGELSLSKDIIEIKNFYMILKLRLWDWM